VGAAGDRQDNAGAVDGRRVGCGIHSVIGRAGGNKGYPRSSRTGAPGGTRDVTVLFLDEVHRFNKAQQDSFLPHVEDSTLVLSAPPRKTPRSKLSARCFRARVYVLKALEAADIRRCWSGR
jgi:hypothetical protein